MLLPVYPSRPDLSTLFCAPHGKAWDFRPCPRLPGLGLNQIQMHLGTAGLGIHYLLVKLAVTAIVMACNFITRKLFLERRPG